MEEYKKEYSSRLEEIRDGWRGTWIGLLCILFMVLAFNEFAFSDAYHENGEMVTKSIKLAVVLAFAYSLFFIKDEKDTTPLEKVRLNLFVLLFCCVFSLWIVPFSNRFMLPQDKSELVNAYIHGAIPGNSIRIGKKTGNTPDFVTLKLEVLKQGTSEVAKSDLKEREMSLIKADFERVEDLNIGQIIQVRRFQGRWGQAFIELP